MMKYMIHPRHGAMHVYSEAEIEENEKHGWKLTDEPGAVKVLETIMEGESKEKCVAEQYQAKFGKPPHHKMKPETIERALRG